MAKIIDDLLTQEMDRREFLVRVGAAALTVVGVTGMLKAISGSHSQSSTPGYGHSPYGGGSNSTTRTPRSR